MGISKKNRNLKVQGSNKNIFKVKNKPKNAASLEYINKKCTLIAEISESILENPSSAFKSSSTNSSLGKQDDSRSKMRILLDFSNTEKDESDVYTARLSIMSLVAIFLDIIPTYRIRLPTGAEMAVRVKKEVKALRDYERALLQSYQQFLKLLERTWDIYEANELGVTAILSLCELLKKAPHFNFRSNILGVVVRKMNYGHSEEISEACCCTIEYLFQSDVQGSVALEATRLVCKLIRDRKFCVKARVLKTFTSLPLRVHIDEAQAVKLVAMTTAKKRKLNKEEAKIEAELKEGSGAIDKISLARSQAETLEAITILYFKILKNEDLSTDNVSKLLPVALEGLAAFAHLINMDTVLNLLKVLKAMLKRVDELPLNASLNCILTAFQTLQGPGRELKIDQKEYITPLFSQLSRLCTEDCDLSSTKIALRCLDSSFLKRREYSSIRTASFLKQLTTLSLHSSPSISTPILAFCRQLLHKYSSLHQLLENEEDVLTSGQYDPLIKDPEHTNPYATSCWELSTLMFHSNPAIALQATRAANMKLIQLPTELPQRIQTQMQEDSLQDFYLATKRIKKRHPLAHKDGEKQKVRFISPNPNSKFHCGIE